MQIHNATKVKAAQAAFKRIKDSAFVPGKELPVTTVMSSKKDARLAIERQLAHAQLEQRREQLAEYQVPSLHPQATIAAFAAAAAPASDPASASLPAAVAAPQLQRQQQFLQQLPQYISQPAARLSFPPAVVAPMAPAVLPLDYQHPVLLHQLPLPAAPAPAAAPVALDDDDSADVAMQQVAAPSLVLSPSGSEFAGVPASELPPLREEVAGAQLEVLMPSELQLIEELQTKPQQKPPQSPSFIDLDFLLSDKQGDYVPWGAEGCRDMIQQQFGASFEPLASD